MNVLPNLNSDKTRQYNGPWSLCLHGCCDTGMACFAAILYPINYTNSVVILCLVWVSLQWRHTDSDGVSNHRRLDCLRYRLFRRRSKKTSKLHVTGLCEGNSPVTGEFPAQRVSNAEKCFHLVTSSCGKGSWWIFVIYLYILSRVPPVSTMWINFFKSMHRGKIKGRVMDWPFGTKLSGLAWYYFGGKAFT